LGRSLPGALKIFLLSLAILDDLGAILIIAIFYTAELHLNYLFIAILPLAGLIALNLRGTHRIAPIVLLGVILWVLVLKSGVHATIAGVVTAFFVPLTDRFGKSPLHALEDALTPYVNFLILPIFAFANAGVMLAGLSLGDFLAPIPLGIACGLIIGKQLGIFATTWLVVRSGIARLPDGVRWQHVYGLSCLAGIGFTMSLFIGGLSFNDFELMNGVRLGVISGSVVSAILGYAVLRATVRSDRQAQTAPAAT
jgi:Na+:H+ antiporter, NhaA family